MDLIKLWERFRALLSWRLVRDQGVRFYYENERTGCRFAARRSGSSSPVDYLWLDAARGRAWVEHLHGVEWVKGGGQ